MMDSAIKIWEFEKAPEYLKRLSEHGGDEDGVCWIPNGVVEPWWLERLWSQFGDPQRIVTTKGIAIIWAHA